MDRLLRRGPSQERGCLVCRSRKKKCVFPPRDEKCQDCRKFWIQCIGVGAARPPQNCEKEIIKLTKRWIKGKKNVDRSQPPLPLSHFLQDVASVTHHPSTEESPESPVREGMGVSHLPSLVVSALASNSGPHDPSLPFPEPSLGPSNGSLSPHNGNFVWDMQQLALAPVFFNLHNPRGLITALPPGESYLLAESSASPVRIVLDSMTGTNNENLDDLALPEASSSSNLAYSASDIYKNFRGTASGSSFNDPPSSAGTRSNYSSEFIPEFEGHGSGEHPHNWDH